MQQGPADLGQVDVVDDLPALGDRVVDAFYVRTAEGGKIVDDVHLAEVRRALLHALDAG